jgi:nucleolar protein 56
VLFEHAVGYALLALKEVEEISLLLPQVGELGGLAELQCSP